MRDDSRSPTVLVLWILMLSASGCEETNDECLEAPDPEGALPVDIEGASWGLTFCARYEGGGLRCWGDNRDGQIGPFPEYPDVVSTPTVVKNVACALSVGCGASATCAVLTYGNVQCWGSDGWGQIGNGGTRVRTGEPDSVHGIYDAVAIGGYGLGMSAQRRTGEVLAWGLIGSVESDSPVRVAEIGTGAVSYGLFARGGCDVRRDEILRCWGKPMTDPAAPTEPSKVVETGQPVRAVIMEVDHACLLSPDGAVSCWGNNESGELGDGTTIDRDTPTPVSLMAPAAQVSLGTGHTCARLEDGSVWCWGHNFGGPVGPNGENVQRTPVRVPLPARVVDIATTLLTSCALDESGAIWCWGQNADGELGIGENIIESFEPRQVAW